MFIHRMIEITETINGVDEVKATVADNDDESW